MAEVIGIIVLAVKKILSVNLYLFKMTKEDIIQGNKIIHPFMEMNNGWVFHESDDKGGGYTKFHHDWTWLMTVVEKIGNMTIPKEWLKSAWDLKIHFSINTIGTSFEIGDHDLHITDSGIEAKEWLNISKTTIEKTWLCVIEFIKWYNEQKNK